MKTFDRKVLTKLKPHLKAGQRKLVFAENKTTLRKPHSLAKANPKVLSHHGSQLTINERNLPILKPYLNIILDIGREVPETKF